MRLHGLRRRETPVATLDDLQRLHDLIERLFAFQADPGNIRHRDQAVLRTRSAAPGERIRPGSSRCLRARVRRRC